MAQKNQSFLVRCVKGITELTRINLHHFEIGIAAIVLIVTGILSEKGYVEWIGVLGVLLTFEYTIIANYLGEFHSKRVAKDRPQTMYHRRLLFFYYLKEGIWLIYFLLLGAWSALVGVFLFIFYAFWRSHWNKQTIDVVNMDMFN